MRASWTLVQIGGLVHRKRATSCETRVMHPLMGGARSFPVLLTAIALAAGSLSACGAAEKVADAADPVAAAVAATSKSSGSRFEMTMSMAVPDLPKPVTITATGVCDWSSGAVQMKMDMRSILDTLGTEPPEDFDPSMLQIEMRIVGGAFYAGGGMFAENLAPGKKWLKMSVADLAKSAGIDPALTSQYQDPTQMLRYLKAAGEVEKLGEETVRGETTTRYRAQLDFATALRDLGTNDKTARKEIEALKLSVGDTELPVDVWIGEDDLVRRMRMVMKLAEGGSSVDANVDMEMFDYNTEVSIKAPPSDEVADGSKVFGGAASGEIAAP